MEIGAYNQVVDYFVVTLNASIQQITADKTKWATKVMLQTDPNVVGVTYIGSRKGTATAPTTLDDTDCLVALNAGGSYEPPQSLWAERGGGQFQLEQFYVKGPNGGHVYVSFTRHGKGTY